MLKERARLGRWMAATLALVLGAAGVVHADDGDTLSERSDSAWTILPERGAARIETQTTLRNMAKPTVRRQKCPGKRQGICKVRTSYTYDDWIGYWVPERAGGVVISGPGVTATSSPRDGGSTLWTLAFPKLAYKKTQRASVVYEERAAAGPEDLSSPLRIEDGYIHHCWYGHIADRGAVSFDLPTGYSPVILRGELDVQNVDGHLRLASGDIDEPSDPLWCAEAFTLDRLERWYITGDEGRTLVTVSAWPGHDAWGRAVANAAATALPWLEETLGRPLPSGSLELREVSAQSRPFSDGDRSPRDGVIGVVETSVSPASVGRHLARAWAARPVTTDAWLIEGSAAWLGARAVGESCPDPGARPGEGEPDLDGSWVTPSPTSSWTEVELASWQSAAACDIVEAAAGAIGDEAMAELAAELLAAPDRGLDHWLDAISEGPPQGVIDVVAALGAAGIEA